MLYTSKSPKGICGRTACNARLGSRSAKVRQIGAGKPLQRSRLLQTHWIGPWHLWIIPWWPTAKDHCSQWSHKHRGFKPVLT